MATAVWPVLTNTQYHAQINGTRFMPTQFKSQGTSLHPLQRIGAASNETFPVSPPRGPQGIAGHMPARHIMPMTPPLIAFAGPNRISHTRVPNAML